ncbi:MFS general substrate transporter [Microthyrium microscopicum]|uniref:MFS general substrate transporter n=1 Tax=Microthyrium microscopicum TaxID=703497 RepID=A0A6A6UE98_9PEZI|nr:MFS general substrate transporter [Microthyrium microscopicum]
MAGRIVSGAYKIVSEKLQNDEIFEENIIRIEAYESEREITRAFDEYETDTREERELVRKIDVRILPILGLVYAAQSMDKAGMNGTRLAGKARQFYNNNHGYSTAMTTMAVGYIALVVASNMVLSRVRPSQFLAGILVVAGIMNALSATMPNIQSMLVARLPGATIEAVTFPAILYILSCWYKPREIGKRIAIFPAIGMITQAISTTIARNSVAFTNNLNPWRAIFMVNGLILLGAAPMVAYSMLDYPAISRLLSRRERELATIRLLRTGQDTGSSTRLGLERLGHVDALIATIRDPRILLIAGLSVLLVSASSASHLITSTSSSVLQAYSPLRAHHIAPGVFIFGLVVLALTMVLSDRSTERRTPIIALLLAAIAGPATRLATHTGESTIIRVMANALFVAAIFSVQPLLTAWLVNTIRAPAEKRAVAIALVHGVATTAAVGGARMWPRANGSRTRIDAGMATSLLAIAAVAALAVPAMLPLKNYRGTRAERSLETKRRARVAVEEMLEEEEECEKRI